MPSPFPGMDPYLEDPVLWPGVHQFLITYLSNALNRLIPSNYVARIGERLYVVQSDRNIYPDMGVFQRTQPPASPAGDGGIAVAADPAVVITLRPVQVREVFINVVYVGRPSRLVTAIEVLSPTNKAAGPGRDLYQAKQQEVLASAVHLLEIDLLRQGGHTVAIPREALEPQADWDYLVCLHRAEQTGRFDTWPILLQQRLPRVSVPLTGGDPDVVVDLQALLSQCYDDQRYAGDIDYQQDPPHPLRRTDVAWADQLLREHGLRT